MVDAQRLAIRAAFQVTLPIFTGFIFLGAAYGVMMTSLGFSAWMPVLMALVICAGSMEFVTVSMLLAAFNPVGAMLMTLMVNGRHLFYGLSLLEPYQTVERKKRSYMIFALVDETYSLLVAVPPPKGADEATYMFYVTLFNHSFWVLGTALGAFGGQLVGFNTSGIEFVMTALFVAIFTSQWREGHQKGLSRGRRSALIGLIAPLLARILFGPEQFMIPAMILVLMGLLVLRPWIEKGARRHES